MCNGAIDDSHAPHNLSSVLLRAPVAAARIIVVAAVEAIKIAMRRSEWKLCATEIVVAVFDTEAISIVNNGCRLLRLLYNIISVALSRICKCG